MFKHCCGLVAACIAVSMLTVACGSPETPPAGTTPAPAANPPGAAAPPPPARSIEGYAEMTLNSELASNLGDLERDIQNIVARRPNAASEFAEDLYGISDEKTGARTAIDALSRELDTALPTAKDGARAARRLSELLFVATRGRLNDERLGQVQTDVQKLLGDHGVAATQAQTIAGHVVAIGRAAR